MSKPKPYPPLKRFWVTLTNSWSGRIVRSSPRGVAETTRLIEPERRRSWLRVTLSFDDLTRLIAPDSPEALWANAEDAPIQWPGIEPPEWLEQALADLERAESLRVPDPLYDLPTDPRWPGLETINTRMLELLMSGEALDVRQVGAELPGGTYELRAFEEGKDYCDGLHGWWIWSVGRHRASGKIIASTRSDLYQHPGYECLFLR